MIARRTATIGLLALLAQAPAHAEEVGKAVMLPAHAHPVRTLQFRAPGDGPRPSVLILHGAGGFDRRLALYNTYAAGLAAAGIDAYLVYYYAADDTGAGDEFEQQYELRAKLVGDIADRLLAQKESNGKLALIGFSNGGILATGAATLDARITAAVIYYGTEPWPLGRPAKRYPPMLVLHGDADRIIPVSAGMRLSQQAKQLGAPVDLVIYPGEGHGFGVDTTTKTGVDSYARVQAFLRKELLGQD
jgi:carboxymethylenebutenolidase